LDALNPESQQQVAGRLRADQATMVALLDGLEAKGLVARHADAEDRRRNVVELTEDGRTALARAVRASDEAERQLLADLDDAESAQLRTLLTRLTRDRSKPWLPSPARAAPVWPPLVAQRGSTRANRPVNDRSSGRWVSCCVQDVAGTLAGCGVADGPVCRIVSASPLR
jgi:DNA-binding MarR family transcriptional regulator